MIQQRTLKNVIHATGVGLHTGEKVYLTLRPAAPNTGVVFRRVDLPEPVDLKADPYLVGDTRLSSCLERDGVRVSTVEHLMSALAGLGIALKSTWDVRKQLEDGSLVALCSNYTFGNDVGIYAVYPHRRHLPAKVRAFVDFLAESFGPEPEWDSGVKSPKPRIKGRAGN